ncbi:MAG: hypothetical protein PHF97_06260 [Bacteroidales bacterium]|nr:hypothetical protein [Bacteroidales bacterium]
MASSLLHSNPFPGIRSYEIQEDELFFGREFQVRELIDKLSETRFLAILGSSGCGKSSLIRAGLIPSLMKSKTGKLSGEWKISIFKPGDDPIGNLTDALLGEHTDFRNQSAETLRKEGSTITDLLKGSDPSTYHLLVIDQFEEIFRYKRNRDDTGLYEISRFVHLFLDAIHQEQVRIYVVLSMRTDFLDDCTEFREFSEMINKGYYLVPRMNQEERRLAITGPIHVMESKISDELVDRLLKDVGDDPDQLPILQHAMMRTWDYWKLNRIGDQPIGIDHYEAIGTMKEALSVHLEEIYASLKDHRKKYFAEKLFKSLTDVSKDSRGTRRPTSLKEICTLAEAREEEIIQVIDTFREPGRAFIMPSIQVGLTSETTIDISHESIMRVWIRLHKWVEEESQSAQLYLRLAKTAELYQYGKSGLWVNPELQLALQWKEQNKPNATWAVRYDPSFDRAMNFLEYSKKQFELELTIKEKQQKRNLKRARNSAVILGIASVISIFFLIISLNLRFKAEASRKEAMEKEKLAVFEQKRTEEQRKEAILQKKISEQQQQIAEQQKIITEQQRQFAVKQQVIAQEQTAVAVHQKQQAIQSRQEAVVARDEAQTQKKEAISQKQIADNERVKAEESEKNARRLRLLSVARSMAIQANQLSNTLKDDLPGLLAIQAYRFNLNNGGVKNDPIIYTALSGISNDPIILRGHEDGVRSLSLTSDGKTLFSCGDDSKVLQWAMGDLSIAPVALNISKHDEASIRSLVVTHDDQYIIAGNMNGKLLIWDRKRIKDPPRIILAHKNAINGLCIHPEKNLFVSVGSDGKVLLWNYGQNEFRETTLDSLHTKINCVALSGNGRYLAYGTSTGMLKWIDLLQSNPAPMIVTQKGDAVLSIAFSHDGKQLAAGYPNGSIHIYDTRDPLEKPREIIGWHASGVTSIVFSRDGKQLASASYDRTIKLGSIATSEIKPISIESHDLWVYYLLFSFHDFQIISASADKSIRIFSTENELMAEKLIKTIKRNMTPNEWNKFVGADIPYVKIKPELP